jgi:acyl transferase domain-containing protein
MTNLRDSSGARPRNASAKFRIGLRSVPILKDHCFRGMVVLPGSLYINIALSLDREISRRVPRMLHSVVFGSPIILATEDTVIKLSVTDHGRRSVYTFYEARNENGSAGSPGERCVARLEIDASAPMALRSRSDPFSVEAFQSRSGTVISSEQFYETLRENGNHYGPSFQRVSSIWRAGNESLGILSGVQHKRESSVQSLDPSLLDSMIQLLASLVIDKGKTFVLRSIEKVELRETHFPDTLWDHAVLHRQHTGDNRAFLGHIRVFDQKGKTYVELFNVAFNFLNDGETRSVA